MTILEKPYLTTEEVCELTGLKAQTIYQLVWKESIPNFKFGRLLRFKTDAILIWIETRNDAKNIVVAE